MLQFLQFGDAPGSNFVVWAVNLELLNLRRVRTTSIGRSLLRACGHGSSVFLYLPNSVLCLTLSHSCFHWIL